MALPELRKQLERDGFALVRNVYAFDDVREIAARLALCLQDVPRKSAPIRSRGGKIYAARNLLDLFPDATGVWQREALVELLTETLGHDFGLVRGLFFDKPPDQSWSLAWHRDLTIAVRDNNLPSGWFTNPTHKAGIPHVQAQRQVLEAMLTLRIHLDAATEENGALRVLPGSHADERLDPDEQCAGTTILADAGDVLAMRPLLAHCSGASRPSTNCHRRVIHLEFAAKAMLPDGFQWHRFWTAVS